MPARPGRSQRLADLAAGTGARWYLCALADEATAVASRDGLHPAASSPRPSPRVSVTDALSRVRLRT
ncbi:hypothetical protein [Streptomyces lydicus]|uniref:hypothetical protein n=1 Tax=Streptomyces lydicus TaxID=47763 RepID=UPI0037BD928B